MDDAQLAELVATFDLPGWKFTLEGRSIRVELDVPPIDNRGDGVVRLTWFGDFIFVERGRDERWVTDRVFVTLQYLRDHELREEFTVRGRRPHEAHDPPVTGYQKEWYVEHESALRGY